MYIYLEWKGHQLLVDMIVQALIPLMRLLGPYNNYNMASSCREHNLG